MAFFTAGFSLLTLATFETNATIVRAESVIGVIFLAVSAFLRAMKSRRSG